MTSKSYPFVSPLEWRDPYEKYFLELKYVVNKSTFSLPIKEKIFASCFSGTSNSEAYWNVYAPNSDGVRIGFEAEPFLLEFLGKIKNADVFIGPINYYNTNDFSKKGIDISRLSKSIRELEDLEFQVELMFRKRIAFIYENEIRVVILPNKNRKGSIEINHSIDLGKLAFDITFDPRMGVYQFNFLKENLLQKYGIRVSKASLYKTINVSPWTLASN
jgi:hypothetical protein